MAAKLTKNRKLPVEPVVESFVPYTYHCTDNVIKTESGEYLAILQLEGVVFESSSPMMMNSWFRQFHNFMRSKNISSTDIGLHAHILRVRSFNYPEGEFTNSFARNFNEKYKNSIKEKLPLENRLYLTIIYRPNSGIFAKTLSIFDKVSKKEMEEQHKDCLQHMQDIINAGLVSLKSFAPRLLGVYEYNDFIFSEPLEFLGFLVNNEWRRMPYPDRPISRMLPTSRIEFSRGGGNMVSIGTTNKYMCILGITGYPKGVKDKVKPTVFDELLKAPYEFTLSQSFTFTDKTSALFDMGKQQGQKNIVKDHAVTQISKIDDAKEGIDGNDFGFGKHSFALLVKGDSVKQLHKNINEAGHNLSDAGAAWMIEDLVSDAAFYSMLPGNWGWRINVNKISTEYFACLNAYHNFPRGRDKSQWGNPVTVFETMSKGNYQFNFHDTNDNKIVDNKFEPASTLFVGKTGEGKTVLLSVLLLMLQKFRTDNKKLTCALFDRGLGLSIIVRQLGGKFYPLKIGVPSGFQPMQLDPTKRNIDFMVSLIKQLVKHSDFPLQPIEDKAISDSVESVISLPQELRTLTAVLRHLQGKVNVNKEGVAINDVNSIAVRLAKWCQGGQYGWLFDNPEDTLDVDLPVVAFDVEEFLENKITNNTELKTATLFYLMHRIKSLRDGRRLPIAIDEFGVLLDDGRDSSDSVWADEVENGIVTARKLDSFYILIAQDPQQVLRSKNAYALINQTSTQIFLPNDKASERDYTDPNVGFGLTKEEYLLIRNFELGSRKMLIKQGNKSVVVRLSLENFEDELAVLSGNVNTSALAEKVINEVGDDPDVWLPEFQRRRKL